MTALRDIAIAAVNQAYNDAVRSLFNVLRLEIATSHGRHEEPAGTFGKGLENLNLVRRYALQAIEDSEMKS